MSERKIKKILTAKPTLEGAGVHLHRGFGYYELPDFDPFLMFDDFSSDYPEHYLPGFPWHPHRGIETITYMHKGRAEHGDSMGNKGVINSGDVQWMTAGSGIIHQEMPKPDPEGKMYGFQLWANLPASHKMMKPRYRGITGNDIPTIVLENHVQVKIISGSFKGTSGPVKDIITDPSYFDIEIPENMEFILETQADHKCFIYVYEGVGVIQARTISHRQAVLFEEGMNIRITTGNSPFKFLFISGKPLNEPIAWRGPIVMNTDEELRTAFEEYHNGTFIKK
jgi:quercetin 2,3-dioxygenase